jgi:cytochrome c-type biogenesis protein
VVGIFALSLTAGEAVGRLGTFLWFGLGFGLPLLALSLLSGATQRWITTQFTRRARLINVIAGLLLLLLLLLVVIGLYDLWTNRELIGTFLA